MELTTKTAQIRRLCAQGDTQTGVDGDIIIPDIKPDILKILQVDGQAVVLSSELSEGRLTIEGKVDLKILYIPDRENEKINSVSKSFEFSHRIDKNELSADMSAQVSADVERLDFHAVNSRKLRIKAVVSLCYEVKETCSIAIPIEIEGEENIQMVKSPVSLYHTTESSLRDFVLKESMELPSGQSSIENLLKCDVAIKDKDYKVVSGRIVTKGICSLCALYTDPAGEIKFTEADIPFTEIFDCDDVEEDTHCDIDYTVTDLVCEIAPDSDGDMRILNLEIMLQASICASELIETEMISDCYVPGVNTELAFQELEIDHILSSGSTQLTLRDCASPSKGDPQIKGIYSVISKTKIEKTSVMNGKTSVDGSVCCYILYLSESEENPVYSCSKDIPFSCTVETPGSKAGMACEIKSEATHTGYSINSAGDAELRCIVSIDVKIVKKETMHFLQAADTYPLEKSTKKGIIIYFVQPDDCLWEIAKRYRVSQEAIMKLNGLDSTSLKCGERLVIPSA